MTKKTFSTDIAFTAAVKAMQEKLGTRPQMEIMSERRGFQTEITDDLAAFIAARNSFFMATANTDGQPYIQHRGGSPGFLKVKDARTLCFDDLPGNRQYISLGNLSENPRVHLFFLDYETATRIKLWGRARVIETSTSRSIEITLKAWDVNCSKHIPKLYSEETVAKAVEKLTARIAELEARLPS